MVSIGYLETSKKHYIYIDSSERTRDDLAKYCSEAIVIHDVNAEEYSDIVDEADVNDLSNAEIIISDIETLRKTIIADEINKMLDKVDEECHINSIEFAEMLLNNLDEEYDASESFNMKLIPADTGIGGDEYYLQLVDKENNEVEDEEEIDIQV